MEQQDSMEQQQENTQPGAAGYGLDVGAILREARESAGMSVEEVAGRIKFAPRQIVALESGDYAQLPEMAFIRGFVRSYARMLELDDKALLSALPGAPAPVAVQVGSAGGEVPRRGAERRKQNLFWLGGAVVLVAVVVIAWKYDAGEALPGDAQGSHAGTAAVASNPAPSPVAASAPAATAPGGNGQPAEAAPAATAVPVETAPPAHTIPSAPKTRTAEKIHAVDEGKAASKPEQMAATSGVSRHALHGSAASSVAAAAPGASHPVRASRPLRFEFDEDSWVEVTDGTGRVLLSMMGKQGSARNVSGPPPLSVVVGNASGVKLFYKGQPIDLKPIAGTEVARLKLE